VGSAPGAPSQPALYSNAEFQERLRAAVAETLRRCAARKAERQAFKKARDHGLTQRHAAKLARNRAETLTPQQNPEDAT
jgi:hypothetical protein